MLIRPRYLRRYRQIVEILADYGFGAFLAQMGMSDRLNIPRWWRRRRDMPGDAMTNPRRLRRALEDLGPTFIKFGQILSTRSDIMPPRYLEELSFLQDEVPPVSWDEARQVVETELGAPVEDLFAQVDPVPIASASLAQVHVARVVGGEEVVVKIQRPNIEKTVNLDLDIIYDLADLRWRIWLRSSLQPYGRRWIFGGKHGTQTVSARILLTNLTFMCPRYIGITPPDGCWSWNVLRG